MDETDIQIYDRLTLEPKGSIECPHDGEWGWDFEMEGIYETDILITRACGPPHQVRLWNIEQSIKPNRFPILEDKVDFVEILCDSGPLWAWNRTLIG